MIINAIFLAICSIVNLEGVNLYGDMERPITSVPDSVASIYTVDGLKLYSESNNRIDRINAAIQLGKINNEPALDALFSLYETEHMPNSMEESYPSVKYYILKSIGEFKQLRANSFLFGIAKEYSQSSLTRDNPGKPNPNYSDSIQVFYGAIDGLVNIPSTESITLMDSITSLVGANLRIRTKTCLCYYTSILNSSSYKTISDSMAYLVNSYIPHSNTEKWIDNSKISTSWVKGRALRMIMVNIGKKGANFFDQYINQLSTDDGNRVKLEAILIEELKRE